MIDDKTTKKTKWLYFGLARHTFITNDGYKIIEIVRTLSIGQLVSLDESM